MSIRMNWRLASRLSVIICVILVVIIVTLIQHNTATTNIGGGTNASGLQGTDLGSTPAPNFQLTDQNGQQVSLTQFKGKPVVLGFLYTNCPDICPLTAEHLHSTLQSLGNDAQNVVVLAVSTDPRRDNTEAAQAFTKQHSMQNYWHFLIGTQQQLAPVWSSYSIYAKAQQQTVNHSSSLYVIDKKGNERVLLDGGTFKPADLAANLKILLQEN